MSTTGNGGNTNGDGEDADPQARTISASSLEAADADAVKSASASAAASASSPSKPLHGTSPEEGPQLLGGRYEILGMLGAGAMGTVYRARDRELDEIVALKVLKKELASKEMIERFRREVKLARRVTHKNVARTFDIGEHGGDRFLTMEFIEGEMLGALLARRRRLPLPEVARLTVDICAGLSAAHVANVLHRDLKPENVIVAKGTAENPNGRAVITDFGIARAVAEGELSRTVGGIVGTPAYMAPEQVEGATDLDARADLYALGTMLYELITGEMAWTGDSIVTIAAGRLLRPPPDPRTVMPSLPARVAELVLKLMARQRDDRFASADEVAYAIEQIGIISLPPPRTSPSGTLPLSSSTNLAAAAPAPSISPSGRYRVAAGVRTLAVLPIINLGSSEDAYLVDSVNEDVVDLLSVAPGLLVRPRGETARFDDPKRDVREIGRSLGVNVVVDGSLRRIGETVRASFRLITVDDGFQLWARRFDRAPAQVLSIADDAAHAIAHALTADLTESQAPSRAATTPEAEELFLRGRYLMRRGWHGATREAAEMMERAHARASDDPRITGFYALALARVYGMDFFERETAERARALAMRAIERDPRQAEAKVALATIHLQNGEGDAAVRYLREALTLAPNCIEALDWLGRIEGEIGRVEDAISRFERVTAIDPEAFSVRIQIGRLHAMMGRRAEAAKLYGPLPKHPSDTAAWFLIQGRDALWHRDVETAKRLRALLDSPDVDVPQTARFPITGMLEITMGETNRLAEPGLLDRVLPIDGSRPPRRASFNAQLRTEILLSVKDHARAIEMVGAADGHGLIDLVWVDNCPLLEPIRSDPQLVLLTKRVRLRAERVGHAIDARISPTGTVVSVNR